MIHNLLFTNSGHHRGLEKASVNKVFKEGKFCSFPLIKEFTRIANFRVSLYYNKRYLFEV